MISSRCRLSHFSKLNISGMEFRLKYDSFNFPVLFRSLQRLFIATIENQIKYFVICKILPQHFLLCSYFSGRKARVRVWAGKRREEKTSSKFMHIYFLITEFHLSQLNYQSGSFVFTTCIDLHVCILYDVCCVFVRCLFLFVGYALNKEAAQHSTE